MAAAAASASIGVAVLRSAAAGQTVATQVLVSMGGHSERSSRNSRTVRKFPVGVAERADSIKLKDVSIKGRANTITGNKVTIPAESEEMSSCELSDLSAAAESGRGGNFQENILESDKEFSEAEEEKTVSFIWEAGSKIEKVTREGGPSKNRNDTEDKKFTLTVEKERHERLKAMREVVANFPESENELNAREAELLAFSDNLMNQSAVDEDEYRRSQEALLVAERMVFQLKTQVGQVMEDVASRDALLRLSQKEASVSSESLQSAAQSLSEAERKIMTLEDRVQTGEEALGEERDKRAAAMKAAASLQEATRVAENKISELTSEISTLKALVSNGRKAEYLGAQVKAFEQELKSRDSLLLEIRGEIKRRIEALTIAAQIKQDLDAARQREVQLTQSLESANNLVKELQTELQKNMRSLRAEQQMEKMLRDANLEVQRLRKGVEERDKSILVMKGEVELNIGILHDAARDREELRKIKRQMKGLKAELGSKDTKLRIMREEIASAINLARQKSASSGMSSSNPTSHSAAESNLPVQVSKPKKKL